MARARRKGGNRGRPGGRASGAARAVLERTIRIPEPIEGIHPDEVEAALACVRYLHDFLRAAEEAGTFRRDRDRDRDRDRERDRDRDRDR